MKFNAVPKHMTEGCPAFIKDSERLKRVVPWMQGVRKNKIWNQNVVNELQRIKLLKTIDDKYIVERSSIITKDQEV